MEARWQERRQHLPSRGIPQPCWTNARKISYNWRSKRKKLNLSISSILWLHWMRNSKCLMTCRETWLRTSKWCVRVRMPVSNYSRDFYSTPRNSKRIPCWKRSTRTAFWKKFRNWMLKFKIWNVSYQLKGNSISKRWNKKTWLMLTRWQHRNKDMLKRWKLWKRDFQMRWTLLKGRQLKILLKWKVTMRLWWRDSAANMKIRLTHLSLACVNVSRRSWSWRVPCSNLTLFYQRKLMLRSREICGKPTTIAWKLAREIYKSNLRALLPTLTS